MFMIGLLLLWFVTAFLHDATYFLTFRLMHLLLLFWIFYLMLLQAVSYTHLDVYKRQASACFGKAIKKEFCLSQAHELL